MGNLYIESAEPQKIPKLKMLNQRILPGFVTLLIFGGLVTVKVERVEAHQSGCHSWHSCPSDWGTYVCGDKGYKNYCPPKPTLYDEYMVMGCNAQKQGDWDDAKRFYNSALRIARGGSRNPRALRNPYPGGRPLSFYAEQSIAGKNTGCGSVAAKKVKPTPRASQNCDPAYPDFCIPPNSPDLNCADVSQRNFKVLSPDPHGFDRDGDGVGCER